jgi:hypothetical protein
MIAERFLPASHRKAIVVQSAPGDLIDGLVNFVPVTTQKWMSLNPRLCQQLARPLD